MHYFVATDVFIKLMSILPRVPVPMSSQRLHALGYGLSSSKDCHRLSWLSRMAVIYATVDYTLAAVGRSACAHEVQVMR